MHIMGDQWQIVGQCPVFTPSRHINRLVNWRFLMDNTTGEGNSHAGLFARHFGNQRGGKKNRKRKGKNSQIRKADHPSNLPFKKEISYKRPCPTKPEQREKYRFQFSFWFLLAHSFLAKDSWKKIIIIKIELTFSLYISRELQYLPDIQRVTSTQQKNTSIKRFQVTIYIVIVSVCQNIQFTAASFSHTAFLFQSSLVSWTR